MKYLVEKGQTLPLCACDDEAYFNVLTGDVVDNPKVLHFINNGLKNKSIKEIDMSLIILMIYEQSAINGDVYLVGYDYIINDMDNFVDHKCQPYNESYALSIIKNISDGIYKTKEVWSSSE